MFALFGVYYQLLKKFALEDFMLRKQIFWLFLLAAFILSGTTLFAQAKKQDKKADEMVQPIQPEKPKGKEKLMIFSGDYLKAQLYGFVKFDMVYNTNDVTNESGPFWVGNDYVYWNPISTAPYRRTPNQREFTLKKTKSMRNGSFVMDMRSTRLGLNITGPKVLMADTMANIEMDFWGNASSTGTGERSGMPTMRHAYAKLNWTETGTFLLIGQTWSVLMAMPAQPISVTYIPFGQNGNLFQREPQITLGQKVGVENYNLTIEVSMARAMAGADSGTAGDLYPGVNGVVQDDRGPGEASRYPGGRARLTFVMKPHSMVDITLGGSGHYQLEKHAFTYGNLISWWGALTVIPAALANVTGTTATLPQKFGKITKSYSAQAFAKISVSLVSLIATYWRGNNMDTFGVGCGVGSYENYGATKMLGVPMQGGYGQVVFDLRKLGPIPLMLAAGYGGGMKSNKSFIPVNTILWNEAILSSAQWFINDYLCLGFEFGRHQTKWKGANPSMDYKYHTGLMFSF
jgi:hypothetical protein